MYFWLTSQNDFPNLNLNPDMLSDELMNYSSDPNLIQFAQNNMTGDNGAVTGLWGSAYNGIYQANAILEGVSKSTGMSDAVKKQVTGEAEFVRAFWHFYLVNLFGDVLW